MKRDMTTPEYKPAQFAEKIINTKYGSMRLALVGMSPLQFALSGNGLKVNGIEMRSLTYRGKLINGEVEHEHYSEPNLYRADHTDASVSTWSSAKKYLNSILPEILESDQDFIAQGENALKRDNNDRRRAEIAAYKQDIENIQAEIKRLESEIEY